MKAPPPTSASSAAIHGNGKDPLPGSTESGAGDVSSSNPGCGAVPVVTSSGNGGVTGGAPGEMAAGPAGWLADAGDRDGARAKGDVPKVGDAAASLGTASPLRGAAAAVWAGCAGVVADRSAGRVTLPCRLKSRSWDGPIVSAEGGGAAVTSTGASLFWASAGVPRPSAIAAASPPKFRTTMRRNAVILPRPAVAG